MDITPANLRSIYTGLTTAFNARLAAYTALYPVVCMTVPSTTAMNEYPRMDDMPGIREWIGDRVINDLSAQNYIIRNREFEGTIGIRASQIEDDQLGIFTPIAAQLAQEAASFPDNLVWPLFKAGDTTLCYDGQYYFDTDHPGYDELGREISVANFQAGAQPAWYLVDDTQVIKPMIWQSRKAFRLVRKDRAEDDIVFEKGQFVYGVDGRCNAGYGLWQLAFKSKAALTPENFDAARTAMSTRRKRNGQVINIRATKLLVPPALEGTARRLLNAELVNGGDSNVWKGAAEIVVVPQLA